VSAPGQHLLRNRLLTLLPESDYAALRHHLEPVELPRQFVLAEPNRRIDHVYFPETGIGSLLTLSPQGRMAEAGLFGYEGCSPACLVLGSDRGVHRSVMQVAGQGYRIQASVLVEAQESSRAMQVLFSRYCHALSTQISFTALSNAIHQIDERLARWLLMCHDRVTGDSIPITHEFIAVMLAVRRPSVTTALHILEGNGFIRSERGFVTVRNRQQLEEFGRDAYGRPEKEYERLLGPIQHNSKMVVERGSVRPVSVLLGH